MRRVARTYADRTINASAMSVAEMSHRIID
jgi:hypothetical protein